MIRRPHLIAALLVLITLGGCSSEQPAVTFLNTDIRIIINVDTNKPGGVETEVLTMKPVDLFSIFDRNVRKKGWKKIHENSWKLVVNAKDPETNTKTKFEYTLTKVPQLNNDIVVKEVTMNGTRFSSPDVIRHMRYLDQGFKQR